MTTAQLKKVDIDTGALLSEAKGCTEKDKAWANNHLRAGRGLWEWKPPKLPSEK